MKLAFKYQIQNIPYIENSLILYFKTVKTLNLSIYYVEVYSIELTKNGQNCQFLARRSQKWDQKSKLCI